MTDRRHYLRIAIIWTVWIVGMVPMIDLLLPITQQHGDTGEMLFIGALLAYFASPFLVIAYIE